MPEREMMNAATAMHGGKLPATKLNRADHLRASSLLCVTKAVTRSRT
jgi:hypothetical protein